MMYDEIGGLPVVVIAAAMVKAENEQSGKEQGTFDCPIESCQGTVTWFIAPVSKHTRGKCSSDGCLMWIE